MGGAVGGVYTVQHFLDRQERGLVIGNASVVSQVVHSTDDHSSFITLTLYYQLLLMNNTQYSDTNTRETEDKKNVHE